MGEENQGKSNGIVSMLKYTLMFILALKHTSFVVVFIGTLCTILGYEDAGHMIKLIGAAMAMTEASSDIESLKEYVYGKH